MGKARTRPSTVLGDKYRTNSPCASPAFSTLILIGIRDTEPLLVSDNSSSSLFLAETLLKHVLKRGRANLLQFIVGSDSRLV